MLSTIKRAKPKREDIFLITDAKNRAFLSFLFIWQGWGDSNSQHAVLETAALPIGATPLLTKRIMLKQSLKVKHYLKQNTRPNIFQTTSSPFKQLQTKHHLYTNLSKNKI